MNKIITLDGHQKYVLYHADSDECRNIIWLGILVQQGIYAIRITNIVSHPMGNEYVYDVTYEPAVFH